MHAFSGETEPRASKARPDFRWRRTVALFIAPEPGKQMLVKYIGIRPGGLFARHFHVGQHLFNTDEGLFAVGVRAGKNRFTKVGDTDSDAWGTPQICVKEFASVCNLRIVERRGLIDHDGLPSAKLILTMFDEAGYVARKYEFLPSP